METSIGGYIRKAPHRREIPSKDQNCAETPLNFGATHSACRWDFEIFSDDLDHLENASETVHHSSVSIRLRIHFHGLWGVCMAEGTFYDTLGLIGLAAAVQ